MVVLIGASVLVGWYWDISILKNVLSRFVSMKANTALGFILVGVSLYFVPVYPGARGLSWLCAGAAAILGLATLTQYLFDLDLGIDQMLFVEPRGAVVTSSPGRMALTTALNFTLLSAAVFLSGFRRTIILAQLLGLLAGLIAILTLLGYIHGATTFLGFASYTQMALHTAMLMMVLSAAG